LFPVGCDFTGKWHTLALKRRYPYRRKSSEKVPLMSCELDSNEMTLFEAVISSSFTPVYAKQNLVSMKPGSPKRQEGVAAALPQNTNSRACR
jgi:hypothetical protein